MFSWRGNIIAQKNQKNEQRRSDRIEPYQPGILYLPDTDEAYQVEVKDISNTAVAIVVNRYSPLFERMASIYKKQIFFTHPRIGSREPVFLTIVRPAPVHGADFVTWVCSFGRRVST